jgi:hypothetical protein
MKFIQSYLSILGPEADFAIQLTLPNRTQMTVERPKNHDRYIVLHSGIKLGESGTADLSQLSKDQVDEIFQNVGIEMARSKIEYSINPDRTMYLKQELLIGPTLSEELFMNSVGNMEFAVSLANAIYLRELRRMQQTKGIELHKF